MTTFPRTKKYQLERLRELANEHLDEEWATLAIDAAVDLQEARNVVIKIIEDPNRQDRHGRGYNHLVETSIPLSWEDRTWIHHLLLDLIVGTNTKP